MVGFVTVVAVLGSLALGFAGLIFSMRRYAKSERRLSEKGYEGPLLATWIVNRFGHLQRKLFFGGLPVTIVFFLWRDYLLGRLG